MSRSGLRVVTITFAVALAAALASAFALAVPAAAADAIFAPGEPIVTGFSGTTETADVPTGTDPLDLTLIDPAGKSVIIQKLAPDAPPTGQLIDTPEVFSVTAADVGQVFSVTLDDAPETAGALAPNIYVAATSAYGLNLVVPGPDGNPVRSRTGAPDATFMPGQWGGAGGAEGYPGSIWKIDGETGEVTLFSTIAANTGAGLGNIAYDAASAQFFVSDLDSGLIYRLASDGTIIDTYDHGVTGRPTHGLDAVADDGSAVDVTDPAFSTEDPSTWGITQPERKVYGLAPHNGRLYYSVSASADSDGPQIWSVGIKADGSFGTPRWELDVSGLPSNDDITAIAFDPQGRMLLAQRGATTGAYDYAALAQAGTSSLVRYKREFPDDPATPGSWVAEPQSYAVGLASDGAAAAGGVALGYGFDEDTGSFSGACGVYVWATGDQLRSNPDLDPPVEGPAAVNGLQGMIKAAVRPLNDPPLLSFFTDLDGNTGEDTANESGHVGAVAIWQVCGGPSAPVPTIPDLEPPDEIPPPDFVPSEHYDLSLEKWSAPHVCFDGPTDYWCNYTIRVENTGTVPYWGQVRVHDHLPAAPAGATMTFWPQPPWSCAPAGPAAQTCTRAPVFLFPGDAVTLHEVVKLPKPTAPGVCNLVNVAGIQWPFFGHDDDPSDDFDGAVAFVPAPGCVPGGGVADLTLNKFSFPGNCFDPGGLADYLCSYGVLVTNAGPGNFSGPIQVKDTLGVNAPATTFGPWTCGQAGPVLTCNINTAPVNVPPGWSSVFFVQAHMKKPVTPPGCDLDNKAQIAVPPGGSPTNILPGDDFDTAVTHILSPACLAPAPHTDIEVKKTADTCGWFFGYYCKWTLTITNLGPDPYVGPLKFTDQAVGANSNNLPTVIGGGCTGPAGNLTCDYPIVGLPAATPFAFTFYTTYATSPTLCSANNTATIVFPNPGSVQNPSGNDAVSVGHAIPNPACAGLPELNITKTAKGCSSDPSSTDWLCLFDIKVKNVGAASQPAPVKVRDFNTKPTTFNTAACVPFAVNTWECTRTTPLAAGATWSIQATTHVDPNGVTLADCNVDNLVWISNPFSFDPGHFANASQKVPQLFINPGPGPVYVYCDPPSLKLKKTAGKTVASGDGYDTTFTITATSTGPDPYHGTIELDEDLPDGTQYKSSSWACVPASGNDVHCSSPYVDLPVGQGKSMTIVVHTSKAAAARLECAITNTVNVAISAEVLHSDKGAQYTASATAKLPAEACAKPPACPPTQVKPGGGCCDTGLVWNGKQCAPPRPVPPPPPKCAKDSVVGDNGACICKDGTHGKPGKCVPDQVVPICPRDSVLNDGACECKDGTHGKPGKCVPDQVIPICPKDSVLNDGACECKDGTHGKPGKCVPDQVIPICPRDSVLSGGECVCRKGTSGVPGQCEPNRPLPPKCPRDSTLSDGECICLKGTHGVPGQCKPDLVIVKPVRPLPITPVQPVIPQCPDDSHYDKRAQQCVCNRPLVGKPGACQAQLQILQLPRSTIVIK